MTSVSASAPVAGGRCVWMYQATTAVSVVPTGQARTVKRTFSNAPHNPAPMMDSASRGLEQTTPANVQQVTSIINLEVN